MLDKRDELAIDIQTTAAHNLEQMDGH